jgi:serralysin
MTSPPPGSGSNSLTGTSGADTLTGTAGSDIIYGLASDDILAGGAGTDTLFGGEGNDRLSGNESVAFDNGTTVDYLYGEGGNDFLFAGYGDVVDGGDGFDILALSYIGTDHGINGDTAILRKGEPLVPGSGTIKSIERIGDLVLTNFNVKMVIGDQDDPATVSAWDGDDYLVGQSMSITMYGGNGNDLLGGSVSDDFIYGENGNDKLLGYLGSDQLWGGAGADTFYFTEVGATDTIRDFQSGVDKIDLSAIDANSSLSGDQAFTFIGIASFGGHAGEARVYNSGTSAGFVLALDTNGDGTADQLIMLGSAQPGAADITL